MTKIETLNEALESMRLDEVREGLSRANVHLAGELHASREFNSRSGGYSVSRSRLLVAPQSDGIATVEGLSAFAQNVLADDAQVYRWNQNARVYTSALGERVLFGKMYAGELVDAFEQNGKRVGEHSRSIEVVIMPDPYLADVVFGISQAKLEGNFNPTNVELLLATESLPHDVFQAGSSALREHAVGLSYALERYRQTVNGQS